MGLAVHKVEILAYQSLRQEGYSHRRSAKLVGRAPSTMRPYDPYAKPYTYVADREKSIRRSLRRLLAKDLNLDIGREKRMLRLSDLLDTYPEIYDDIRNLARKYVASTEAQRELLRTTALERQARKTEQDCV